MSIDTKFHTPRLIRELDQIKDDLDNLYGNEESEEIYHNLEAASCKVDEAICFLSEIRRVINEKDN